jgi:hypothetical protein
VLLGVVCGLNTIFYQREELGLARQPGIKKVNLNSILKRAKVFFMKLVRRGPEKAEFSKVATFTKRNRAPDRLREFFYLFVALHDG